MGDTRHVGIVEEATFLLRTTLLTSVTGFCLKGVSLISLTGRVSYEKPSPVLSAMSRKKPSNILSYGKDVVGIYNQIG
jgi:hypothetical protein